MDNILKLYCHELAKNIKKFYIISAFVVFFIIFATYMFFSSKYYGGSAYSNISLINEIDSIFPKYLGINLLHILNKNSIYIIGYDGILMGIISLGAMVTVLMSLDITIRDYRKRNKSIYIYATIPVKIWQMKIAKILCGTSLYWFFSLMLCLGIFVMNSIFKIFGGEYISSIYPYVSKNMIFLPISPIQTLFIMFVYIPTCIIGIQTFSSFMSFNNDYKNKNLVKKIIVYSILIVLGIAMIFYLGMLFVSGNMGFMFWIETNKSINLLKIGAIVFPLLSVVLFIADCNITNKRLRGGVNVKKI